MKTRPIRLVLLVVATALPITVRSAQPALPQDVQHYLDQRALCDHWAGEEPYDKQRARQIAQGVERDCRGLDRLLQRLQHRYGSNPQVMDVLRAYDKVGY